MSVALDSSLGNLEWLTARNQMEEEKQEKEQQERRIEEVEIEEMEESSRGSKGGTISVKRDSSEGMQENSVDTVYIPSVSHMSGTVTYQQDGKPNLSYAELIKRAISESAVKQMTLNEIYKWIMDNFPYYRDQEGTSWKNSIRHNLSLNKQFQKIPRERGDPGKGSYWTIGDSSHDHWTKCRKPRSSHPSDSERSHSVTSCVSNRTPCSNGPRINPVIQALFGLPIQSSQQNTPTEETGPPFPSSVLPSTPEHPPPPTNTLPFSPNHDPYSCSWNSQGSSLPHNFRPFGDLDSSMGSVQSQLSESFRNLYQEALKASFNSSFHNSGVNPDFSCNSQHLNPADQSQNQFHPSIQQSLDQLGGSFASGSNPSQSHPTFAVPEQAVDWLRHQAAAFQQQQPSHSQQQLGPNEIMQSIDMEQFQNMISGSMQSRDLQEWLSHCNPENWRDFLSRSIGGAVGGGGVSNDVHQGELWRQWGKNNRPTHASEEHASHEHIITHNNLIIKREDATADTPPACYGMDPNSLPPPTATSRTGRREEEEEEKMEYLHPPLLHHSPPSLTPTPNTHSQHILNTCSREQGSPQNMAQHSPLMEQQQQQQQQQQQAVLHLPCTSSERDPILLNMATNSDHRHHSPQQNMKVKEEEGSDAEFENEFDWEQLINKA